ncbi:MAG: hypothetical protein ACFCUU_02410 [Cyclobacteriaceae bacterium]
MDRRTRYFIKALAIVIVLVAVLGELGILVIPSIIGYKFWLVVLAFGMLLLASR